MLRVLRTMAVVAGSCLALVMVSSAATAADPPHSRGPEAYRAEMNRKFTSPKLDVEHFVKQFENEGRTIYVKRRQITRAVGLKPGQSVADIGDGTGLFTRLFAEQVAPGGTVYAVDISPDFIKHIAERAKADGQERVIKTVLNVQGSTKLPPASIDVAFLCDTYHQFVHPEEMLASIHRAMRPGGRLVLIDFDLRPDSSKFVKERARAPKEVYFREFMAAGFEPIETKDAPELGDNFYAAFRWVKRRSETVSTAKP